MGSAKSREAAKRYSTENWCRFRILMILPGQWGECWERDDAIGDVKKVFSVSPMAYKAHILITKVIWS